MIYVGHHPYLIPAIVLLIAVIGQSIRLGHANGKLRHIAAVCELAASSSASREGVDGRPVPLPSEDFRRSAAKRLVARKSG